MAICAVSALRVPSEGVVAPQGVCVLEETLYMTTRICVRLSRLAPSPIRTILSFWLDSRVLGGVRRYVCGHGQPCLSAGTSTLKAGKSCVHPRALCRADSPEGGPHPPTCHYLTNVTQESTHGGGAPALRLLAVPRPGLRRPMASAGAGQRVPRKSHVKLRHCESTHEMLAHIKGPLARA